MGGENNTLRRQAWDYFYVHASQRMTAFNFYIILSSLVATAYFSSFGAYRGLQTARPMLAVLLCLLAFVFWKLDQRTKQLIRNAERALKHFERLDAADAVVKVFTQEEAETKSRKVQGWGRLRLWRLELSYSDCFNCVFLIFFLAGLLGVALWASHALTYVMARLLPHARH